MWTACMEATTTCIKPWWRAQLVSRGSVIDESGRHHWGHPDLRPFQEDALRRRGAFLKSDAKPDQVIHIRGSVCIELVVIVARGLCCLESSFWLSPGSN